MLVNFHTHTSFCDGKDTPEEIVLSALEQGVHALGFSGHCFVPFDPGCRMDDTEGYRREVLRLKEKYRDQILILLGIEEDLYALVSREEFSYIIGSAHYMKAGERYYAVDDEYSTLVTCIKEHFASDPILFAKQYFENLCNYIEARKPDIIGHFDLLTKFDETMPPLFLGNPEYERMAVEYACRAAKSGCLFEVNTGAIARGVRTNVYPSAEILHALRREGAKLILSSDSHRKETLLFGLSDARAFVRDIGFREVYSLIDHGMIKHRI